ncbi:hypothetical protein [Alicyclobacillus acidiphilus]|uniref:hypothetical protein n=1 Tax=Alicyclobacillus acidiphilus TaxID=182455 RepID=UPI00082FAEEE|nr:hypothetical protein [Alicyclobacillus acidiphilus]
MKNPNRGRPMSHAHLIMVKPGTYIHPSDPAYYEKVKRFGREVNLFTEIREWIANGQTPRAKRALFNLLRHRESMYVHQLLAPLLTYTEAKDMLHRYDGHRQIRMLYERQLYVISTQRRHVPGWILWFLVILCLLFASSAM